MKKTYSSPLWRRVWHILGVKKRSFIVLQWRYKKLILLPNYRSSMRTIFTKQTIRLNNLQKELCCRRGSNTHSPDYGSGALPFMLRQHNISLKEVKVAVTYSRRYKTTTLYVLCRIIYYTCYRTEGSSCYISWWRFPPVVITSYIYCSWTWRNRFEIVPCSLKYI